MGRLEVNPLKESEQLRSFEKSLLRDVQALEHMIVNGMFEKDVRRIGAEQEFFLVDRFSRPVPLAIEFLERINDPHFTTELAKFNMEINLDPIPFTGNCFSKMKKQLSELLDKARVVAQKNNSDIILNGKAHLRIENRILPSGPTIIDEIANAAFWFGLMKGVSEEYENVTKIIKFDDVKVNFEAASRQGLNAQFTWINGKTISAHDLISQQLLPLARQGLKEGNIDGNDVDRYLDVIKSRVHLRKTGSQWLLRSYNDMKEQGTMDESLSTLTATTVAKQQDGQPIHEWAFAQLDKSNGLKIHNYLRVEQYMTTDVYTIHKDDVIDLVVCLMEWQHIRHIPVEDEHHRLVGMVSFNSLLQLLKENLAGMDITSIPVSSVMEKEVLTVEPETFTLDVINIMNKKGVSSLPVVKNGQIVGIITERDFINITKQLLEEKIRK